MRRSTGRLIAAGAIALFALAAVSTSPAPPSTSARGEALTAPRGVDAPVGVLVAAPGPEWVRVVATRLNNDDAVSAGALGTAAVVVAGLVGWLLRTSTGGSPGRYRRARTRGRAPPALRVV